MPNHNDVESMFKNRFPEALWSSSVVLVAVSGGADSMALLHLFARFASDLDRVKAIHVNHGLRGAESDEDEDFVINTCLELGVECLAVRLPLGEDVALETSEDKLRRLRYEAIEESANVMGAAWIAFGHHQDDNIETFLFRLFRGTGLKGLEGIPFCRPVSTGQHNCQIVRPLLEVSRHSIVEWLESNQIEYRNDSSNQSNVYLRNRIRNELIPLIDSLQQRDWKTKIANLMEDIKSTNEESKIPRSDLLELTRTIQTDTSTEVVFPISVFKDLNWEHFRRYLSCIWSENGWPLQEMSRKHWLLIRDQLNKSLESTHPTGMHLPCGVRLSIRRKMVTLTRDPSATKVD